MNNTFNCTLATLPLNCSITLNTDWMETKHFIYLKGKDPLCCVQGTSWIRTSRAPGRPDESAAHISTAAGSAAERRRRWRGRLPVWRVHCHHVTLRTSIVTINHNHYWYHPSYYYESNCYQYHLIIKYDYLICLEKMIQWSVITLSHLNN